MKTVFILLCVHFLAFSAADDVASTKDHLTVKQKSEDLSKITNGLTSLFTFGLLGGALALYSPKRRHDLSVDRSGYYEDPQLSYAQRVNQYESRIYDRFSGTLGRIGNNARHVTQRLRNAVRRTGQRSLGMMRVGANSIARLASATDRNLRGMARTATKGLRKISSRMNRVGTGSIERMGSMSTNVGVAAVRGLYKVSRAYLKGLDRASRNAFTGLKRAGSTYKRGISRVGNMASGIASAYSRGVKRMGSAAATVPTSLGDVAADGVSRLGELASASAATIGDFASGVGDAALSVPKSLSNVAKDKKMRDCLLQAMCYISTPFIDPNSNYVKRSVELLQENNAEYDEELLVDLAQLNHGEAPLRMEDCDAFKCQVVSLGKKAYDVVSKF